MPRLYTWTGIQRLEPYLIFEKKTNNPKHSCLERKMRTSRKRMNAEAWHTYKLQRSQVIRLDSLFSYAAPSLPVSVFRIPLCQGCVETMMMPLTGDAGCWEWLCGGWSVVGGREGSLSICRRTRGFWMTVKTSFFLLGGVINYSVHLSSIWSRSWEAS